MRRLLLLGALLVSGCSHGPLAPTPAAAPAPSDITYAINIPDRGLATALIAANPNGLHLAPYDAQQQWNYTAAYGGSPNVYYGETAPHCEYPGVGIVVAPLRAAQLAQFTASDWPAIAAPGVTYAWLGRFVYTAVATPGTYVYDPTGSGCSVPRK